MPELSGEVVVELQNDWAYESDDPDADVNTMTSTIEPFIVLTFNEYLSFIASLTFEQIQDPDPNDDTFFDNHGAYVQELKVEFTPNGHVVLYGGKFNPTFGTAWDLAPGIYGADFAEDYELAEMLGFGGAVTFDGGRTGTHTFNAATFFADTSIFSQSIFTDRGNLSIRDGGVANTEDLSSFSATLDTENLAGIDGLNSHVGFQHLAAGDNDPAGTDDQQGVALGLNFVTPVGGTGAELDLLGEVVFLSDVASTADDTHYYTGGAALSFGEGWNIAGSGTFRPMDVSGGADTDDVLLQLTGGKEFENGITLDAGYRFSEEGDIETHILGFLVTKTFDIP